MSCTAWNDSLIGRLYGELDAEKRAALAAHLEACADCRERLDDFRRVRTVLRDDEQEAPAPPRFVVVCTPAVVSAGRRWPHRSSARRCSRASSRASGYAAGTRRRLRRRRDRARRFPRTPARTWKSSYGVRSIAVSRRCPTHDDAASRRLRRSHRQLARAQGRARQVREEDERDARGRSRLRARPDRGVGIPNGNPHREDERGAADGRSGQQPVRERAVALSAPRLRDRPAGRRRPRRSRCRLAPWRALAPGRTLRSLPPACPAPGVRRPRRRPPAPPGLRFPTAVTRRHASKAAASCPASSSSVARLASATAPSGPATAASTADHAASTTRLAPASGGARRISVDGHAFESSAARLRARPLRERASRSVPLSPRRRSRPPPSPRERPATEMSRSPAVNPDSAAGPPAATDAIITAPDASSTRTLPIVARRHDGTRGRRR